MNCYIQKNKPILMPLYEYMLFLTHSKDNMRKNFLTCIILTFISQLGISQSFYTPRNIQQAYVNNTRSETGFPGSDYWQNKGVYDMKIQVFPSERKVVGQETIIYSNNSPDNLEKLVIRFVNNIHKPNAPRGYYAPDAFLDSGLVITHLEVNGEVYDENARNWGTVGDLRLKKAIAPQTTTEIKINWYYYLSKQSGREGQIDSTTFFAAYSYPRISVYDDYNGWDRLDHTGRQEFYNDFNDYNYSVVAPKNYIVHGTGDFLNPKEVLSDKYYQRLMDSYTSDEIIHIIDSVDVLKNDFTLDKEWLEWKFKAEHITDVCFGLSNHYVWDASSVIVDEKTKRRASVQATYLPGTKDFQMYVGWARFSLAFFSKEWPGIPYPYPKMIAFQGYANMEFPMMVNDATTANLDFARLLQDHEMVHTYFPFYMGINETRYAFMDEGWTVMFEYLVSIEEFGKEIADKMFIDFRSNRYIKNISQENDQPMILQSSQQAGMGYGSNSYGKAALFYLSLKDYLGDELFKKCLHTYMNTWNGKHPMPWDFFNLFKTVSNKDLDWFYRKWFLEYNYIDLVLTDVNAKKNNLSFTIQNKGGLIIPTTVRMFYKDGTSDVMNMGTYLWENVPSNKIRLTTEINKSKKLIRVELDNGIFVDFTPEDNVYRVE